MPRPRDIRFFSSLLAGDGPQVALAYLNEAVAHRYTAVYRLEGGTLTNVFLHDKKGEVRPEFLAVVAFDDSFCQFVLRDGAFRTDDSAREPMLDGHPYQGVMVSYHGAPLIDAGGELLGTVCHFDVVSHPLVDPEFELLCKAARLLPAYLPGTPSAG